MTPTHPQRLSELTQKIAKCVTSVEYGEYLGAEEDGEEIWRQRDITLEDVLRALRTVATEKAPYFDVAAPLLGAWEMGKPLSEQSEETVSFLHSILCI